MGQRTVGGKKNLLGQIFRFLAIAIHHFDDGKIDEPLIFNHQFAVQVSLTLQDALYNLLITDPPSPLP